MISEKKKKRGFAIALEAVVRRFAANAVTLVGLALGLAGVYLLPSRLAVGLLLLLLLSLACDAIDGRVARAFGVPSKLGAEFDWAVDVGLSFALAWRVFGPIAATVVHVGLLLLQVRTRVRGGARMSGRALVTFAVAAMALMNL